MKKIVAYSSALALAMSVNISIPQVAHAESGEPGRPFCKAAVDLGISPFPGAAPFESVGECVSFVNHENDKHFICDVLQQIPGVLEVLYGNYGQCVAAQN